MKKRYEHDVYVGGELKTTFFSYDPDPSKQNYQYKNKPHQVITNHIDDDELYRNGPRMKELEAEVASLGLALDLAMSRLDELESDIGAIEKFADKQESCVEDIRADVTAIASYTEENRDRIVTLEP